MLPLSQKIAFVLFALLTLALGAQGFYRLYLRIRRGRPDSERRFDRLPRRVWYSLVTTLTQQRTFKKRPGVGIFHSFIFYGFVFYGLVNLVDAAEGFFWFSVSSGTWLGATYNALADGLSFLVLLGVVALVIRRFALPSRRDFRFNERTLLHKDVKLAKISRDSIIVSLFILFHVGSRAIGAGARIAVEGPDRFQPFATALSHLFTPANAEAWRVFGYWGALGSVLVFFAYFPYSKHVHIFMAPAKYLVEREAGSGVLPAVALDLEAEDSIVGASRLEELAWPRLLDAYACIQCNRCQDVCPATATGKSLSPAALEINKRMELNDLANQQSFFSMAKAPFELGGESPRPLLQFALSAEAAWACTTCGACMEVCPVQDEQMLDIIDIRRNQVMIEGEFPAQLQTAFRGMERAQNPWGINHEQRLAWADGLAVKTIEENPTPDVLYWVGCAASYDPQAQKTARAFVELLNHAEVNFAVLGKKECCTGDSARRAGNEYLYRQLADKNVATLNEVKPKLIVASCPHCMNSIGKEYRQIGGEYKVMHHTEYLERLVAQQKLVAAPSEATITYHDPCYLGRHNGVYDAPRNLLHILGNATVELDRTRENAFCCGAGGAQFWKEEEAGEERISDNRFREVQQTLASAEGEKVLAVGCPFCKSMLGSTPLKGDSDIVIKDVAELLLEGVRRQKGLLSSPNEAVSSLAATAATPIAVADVTPATISPEGATVPVNLSAVPAPVAAPASTGPAERKKWQPKSAVSASSEETVEAEAPWTSTASAPIPPATTAPTPITPATAAPTALSPVTTAPTPIAPATAAPTALSPSAIAPSGVASATPAPITTASITTAPIATAPIPSASLSAPERKKWQPKGADPKGPEIASAALPPETASAELSRAAPTVVSAPERKKWQPKAAVPDKPSEVAGAAAVSAPSPPPVTEATSVQTGDATAMALPESAPVAAPDSGPAPVRRKWNPRKS
jgi:Fe-S oxidoreductase/nitrate reductase gamma subunit